MDEFYAPMCNSQKTKHQKKGKHKLNSFNNRDEYYYYYYYYYYTTSRVNKLDNIFFGNEDIHYQYRGWIPPFRKNSMNISSSTYSGKTSNDPYQGLLRTKTTLRPDLSIRRPCNKTQGEVDIYWEFFFYSIKRNKRKYQVSEIWVWWYWSTRYPH